MKDPQILFMPSCNQIIEGLRTIVNLNLQNKPSKSRVCLNFTEADTQMRVGMYTPKDTRSFLMLLHIDNA